MKSHTQAFFLPAATGQRFCIFYPAQGSPVRGQVLYIHPLAEEMNKARRMAALQARALALAGFDVLQMDLLGCGDSSGDFGDATWQSWIDDVVQACRYLQHPSRRPGKHSKAPALWLWGLRAGCLLATQAASQAGMTCNFLFWQAPSFGQPLLTQFMRLKLAGNLQGAQAKGVMAQMRTQLACGESVDVAGYKLSPGLATGLMRATLTPPAPQPRQRLDWFELSTQESDSSSIATAERFAQWQQAGLDARLHRVRGPSFWQTTEIEEAPALISATTAALLACTPPTLKASCV
jgi:uncharacterized protein